MTTLDNPIKEAIIPIMEVINSKIEEGNYTVSSGLGGALTFIVMGTHRFSYHSEGVNIFSQFQPLSISAEAKQELEKRIEKEGDSSDRLQYEALKAKFENVN